LKEALFIKDVKETGIKMQKNKKAGIPTLQRMPSYLRLLKTMKADGKEYASGAFIAKELGLDPIVVRKDLAITGSN